MSDMIPDPFDDSIQLMPAEMMTLHNVHDPLLCEGQPCAIHHPSDHHMNTWPLVWRGVMFRACPHNRLHPDPDSLRWHLEQGYLLSAGYARHALGLADCDGCCDPDEAVAT